MSFFGGGGGGGGSTPSMQTQIVREAPGIEERKLELMDMARQVAQKPINLPDYQVSGLGSLEQQGINAAGTTGIGAGTVNQGIQQIQGAAAPIGAQQINQYLNPYQSYVTDEIGRQGQMMQNQLGAQAVNSGAFGGGREGVQQAELQGRTLSNIGQSMAQGFQTALGAAQQQQGLQAQTQLAAGQGLGQLGGQQQAMRLADIQAQMQAGAVQRGIGQQALDAQRQTELQRLYEPYQRVEFMKGIMTNLPTTQSSITQTTSPGSNPYAQAAGTGLGAYAAYNMMQPR